MDKRTFSVDGINALDYPKKLNENIRISLHVEEWEGFKKIFSAKFPAKIRDTELELKLALGLYTATSSTFVLSINLDQETSLVSKKTSLSGFGQHVYYDIALAADHIATEFCKKNKLTVNRKNSHWPILQFVVSEN